jgi:pimeloyl-ACP methyl ester carboxylesterase
MKFAQRLVVGYYRWYLNVLARLSKRKAAEAAFNLFCTPFTGKPRKTPSVFAKAEKLHLQSGPYQLVGYRWNHPQPKRVLIIHGFSSTIKKFDHFVMPLVKKGYEVLAFDAPAHGESSGKRVNALDFKEALAAVYHQYGPIQSFIAHSFGGLAVALMLEELPYQEHKKLVLIAPATETTTALNSFCNFLHIRSDVKEALRQLIYEKRQQWPEWYSIRRAMQHIKADVLWIHDADDDVTPWADAQRVQQDGHPNIQFMLTQGLGHRRIYRDNKVQKAIFDFL